MPTWLIAVLTTLLCVLVLVPVAYIFLASLNSDVGVARGEFWPSQFSLESYTKIWRSVGLGKGIINSLVVSGAVAVVSALIAIGTAYVLVRFSFLGKLSIPVTEELLALSGPAKPTQIFRIAAPCAGGSCKHFKDNNCSLAKRIVEGIAPVVNGLPPCQIRSTCRWFRQEGREACFRCPQVVTDKSNASDYEKQIADSE